MRLAVVFAVPMLLARCLAAAGSCPPRYGHSPAILARLAPAAVLVRVPRVASA